MLLGTKILLRTRVRWEQWPSAVRTPRSYFEIVCWDSNLGYRYPSFRFHGKKRKHTEASRSAGFWKMRPFGRCEVISSSVLVLYPLNKQLTITFYWLLTSFRGVFTEGRPPEQGSTGATTLRSVAWNSPRVLLHDGTELKLLCTVSKLAANIPRCTCRSSLACGWPAVLDSGLLLVCCIL